MQPHLCHFFISGEEKEVFPGSRLYKFPLSGEITEDSGITIGEYFSAARQFLLKNEGALLKAGLEAVFNMPVPTDQIHKIVIFLEKHGALYHPLKIQVDVSENRTCSFVLNGAVSRAGLTLIENEHGLISWMNQTHDSRYLPRVFGSDFIQTDTRRIGFFLGEWFGEYKEFHVTEDQGKREIVIWESDGSCHYISERDALEIYQEISRILTYYYDLETFGQIGPWHHAAGDFIVRQAEGITVVRLITVRGYAPLTDFGDGEADKTPHILPSLLFFFLNLTLRMRLDRLNGTGKTVWLGNQVMQASCDGFLSALDEKSTGYDFGDLRLAFIEFFRQFSLEQLIGIMEIILDSGHSESSEIKLLAQELESHCKALQLVFKNI